MRLLHETQGERAESRKATEALQKRAGCSGGRVQEKGLWRKSGRKSKGKDRSGARRLGRVCEAPARDLLGLFLDSDSHLNAWSSRKYVTLSPKGLIGMSSLGTWDLKRNTKFAVYRSRFNSLWSAGE